MEFVKIGKIVNTFGIRGELKLESYTDFVEERFKKGSTIYVGEGHIAEKVASFHFHKNVLQILLDGKEGINLVERYKGLFVYKSKDDIPPLKKGEYYFSDLENLDVFVNGEKKGSVLRVEPGMTSNYLRVVKENGEESLVPFLPAFIENVDLEEKRIDVVLMEGLL